MPSLAPLRLLLADDHAIMREGLKQLLALAPDITVVAEAEHGQQVLDRLQETEIDLLMLDLNMPGPAGEDMVARLRARHPTLRMLVLSMHKEPQIAQRALRAGADGYITKDQHPEVLLQAIRRVAGGGRFIDPGLAERMVFETTSTGAAHEGLTDRELQVLRMIAKGLRVNDIAEQLCISNKTVSTHKARLMEKIGAGSTAELVRYALANGLIA